MFQEKVKHFQRIESMIIIIIFKMYVSTRSMSATKCWKKE